MTYEERQSMKRNALDTGSTVEELVRAVRINILNSTYDPVTKKFWRHFQLQNGTWRKTEIDIETIESIALKTRFYGRIPPE
jgi:hypothetical protein